MSTNHSYYLWPCLLLWLTIWSTCQSKYFVYLIEMGWQSFPIEFNLLLFIQVSKYVVIYSISNRIIFSRYVWLCLVYFFSLECLSSVILDWLMNYWKIQSPVEQKSTITRLIDIIFYLFVSKWCLSSWMKLAVLSSSIKIIPTRFNRVNNQRNWNWKKLHYIVAINDYDRLIMMI